MKKLLFCLIAITQTNLFSAQITFYILLQSKSKNETKHYKLQFQDTDTIVNVVNQMHIDYHNEYTTSPNSITYIKNGDPNEYDALKQLNGSTLTLTQIGLTNSTISMKVSD